MIPVYGTDKKSAKHLKTECVTREKWWHLKSVEFRKTSSRLLVIGFLLAVTIFLGKTLPHTPEVLPLGRRSRITYLLCLMLGKSLSWVIQKTTLHTPSVSLEPRFLSELSWLYWVSLKLVQRCKGMAARAHRINSFFTVTDNWISLWRRQITGFSSYWLVSPRQCSVSLGFFPFDFMYMT